MKNCKSDDKHYKYPLQDSMKAKCKINSQNNEASIHNQQTEKNNNNTKRNLISEKQPKRRSTTISPKNKNKNKKFETHKSRNLACKRQRDQNL